MGWWQVSADTLAGGRFVISPLAEATACLFTLREAAASHPGERHWLDTHLPAYRARLAADPVAARLSDVARGRNWIPDFLTPAPSGDVARTFEEEVALIRDTPPETALADLAVALRGPVPPDLDRPDLPRRAAGLLEWVWTRTVAPTWERRRRVLEADIVARTRQLGQGGWAAAIDDMRPGMRWLGGDRLQINTHDYPPREIGRAQLLFVPVTPRQGWAAWEPGTRYAIVYPCSGALADPGPAPVPRALARLLGAGRAAVLLLLATPKSTTHLVALTGLGLGSVGRHVRILLEAGLAGRRRAGRSVLYYRTAAGDALVAAASPEPGAERPVRPSAP
ncbi:ArsR/SmtB family transcription factor [Bailinhaonella thermotolerans]|uniref:Transcriptional regulator n=1 Tax=Bailinhaonella thermotolerans TaxID=1070861 RepID=A0A3A4AJ47_9ACTN|nr:helix-turn-helix domain-containing protein [Bailinhaonella thermotolerans]RJL27094.1 transcriptional regulator [Bailinhaonella thermotolerans]